MKIRRTLALFTLGLVGIYLGSALASETSLASQTGTKVTVDGTWKAPAGGTWESRSGGDRGTWHDFSEGDTGYYLWDAASKSYHEVTTENGSQPTASETEILFTPQCNPWLGCHFSGDITDVTGLDMVAKLVP